ncbi:rRNA adenine N-6-methyltransferase family protein [Actinopolymorpha rutila]|uniref:16S rRNA A1518/A1519 N6-dimethyltransferase RsmA/KsgA/DIM1 with predicted DNA glycosylase/AP lyase activity n=1 Tax=Actinopolymorpha rutila TaxID=446787 RepID=A0A852ZTU5_9ACTN|nr:rRNA adenine N-6-methyltransferase family protein [Actinopolymorpha rutila]NYH92076.1 16S rRNA A1518/A1519 N6-dimethyltransferase RsmA/KsgA/DIM1 with predicted DNA glycosylase/AP lyase activity [Actinopolymorpha rutila]
MRPHERLDPALFPEDPPLDTALLDQHLLRNATAVRTLVDTAAPTARDVVADLGAGTGVITRGLLRRAVARIYAVELDRRFEPYLEPLTRSHDVRLLWNDFLDVDLPTVTKVVANPPFRATEHLLEWLRRLPALTSATLVMGHAFGDSAVAEPGSARYGRLSLKVQAGFTVGMVDSLSAKDFHPPARSPACILHLVPRRCTTSIDAVMDDAFTRRAGMRMKDLLWYLEFRSPVLGTRSARHGLVAKLRSSPVVRQLQQRRLQQVSSHDLSHLMAELHRRCQRSAGPSAAKLIDGPRRST